MCVRTFDRVEAFIMEFVPGLACMAERIEFAEKRWGLKMRRYLHWSSMGALRNGVFCDAHYTAEQTIPEIHLADVHNMVRADTGIPVIATGAKRSDSRWRKWQMANANVMRDILAPLAAWQKVDVLAYLAAKKIPAPDSEKSNATGIDLSTPSLLWLHDKHPDDFRKLCQVFPYAEAVVWRRKFYG